MKTSASQMIGVSFVCWTVFQAQNKDNIKTLRHLPLCGKFNGDRWFPAQNAGNAENVSIWWRRHKDKKEQPSVTAI